MVALECSEVDVEEIEVALEAVEWTEVLVEEGEVAHLDLQGLSWNLWEEEEVVDVVVQASWTRVITARSAGTDPTSSFKPPLLPDLFFKPEMF